MRTVTLDRVRGEVTVEENFELERPLPVSLSIMTPRLPSAGANGTMELRLAKGAGTPVLLRYGGAPIEAVVEKIPLQDAGLRESWGNEIYRILLNSRQPVASGNWSYEFSAASAG
jgi:hypothetical protein